MANPQKENGYTAIANEIFDALIRTEIPSGERRILDCILRQTYGFQKKRDSISFSQFENMSGLARRNIIYCLQNLEAKRIVLISKIRKGPLNEPNGYTFNKDYESWVVQNVAPQVKKNRDRAKERSAKLRKEVWGSAKPMQKVVQSVVKTVKSFAPTKERVKERIKKEEDAGQARQVQDIIEAFGLFNEAAKKMYGNTTQRQACLDLIASYGYEKVIFIVKKTLPQTNTIAFFPTIITPYQLFQSWAQLAAAVMKYKSKSDIKSQEKSRGIA